MIPKVNDRDAFWVMKEKGEVGKQENIEYSDIHYPKNAIYAVN